MCSHHPDLMCVTCIAERWGVSRNTIGTRWRTGQMPRPFNAEQANGYRWHRDVIEAHEHGERPALEPGLRAVS